MENKPYHDPNLSGLGFTLLAISLHRNPVDIMNPLTRQCLRISKRTNGISVAQRALYSTQETFGLQRSIANKTSGLYQPIVQNETVIIILTPTFCTGHVAPSTFTNPILTESCHRRWLRSLTTNPLTMINSNFIQIYLVSGWCECGTPLR